MSEIIVLDTHIWLWFINGDCHRYPETWQERIETAEHVGVSPVSCYEIALAADRGRLSLPCPTMEWFQDALDPANIEIFPLTPRISARAVELSPIHRDPFDRIIIATALEMGAMLASVDGIIQKYPNISDFLMS
jgi:PIN domain nuclease of toxin-antitoxin system